MVGTDLMINGVRKVLKGKGNHLYIEYLDGKRFGRKEVENTFQLLQEKYQKKSIDIIITLDDLALELCLKTPGHSIARVPLIFAGVNHLDDHDLSQKKAVTGVTEEFDLKGNVELIRDLHPKMKTIHAIIDHSVTGRREKNRLKSWAESNPEVSVSFLEGWTYAELSKTLTELPEHDVLLSFTLFVDREGKSKTMSEISTYVRQHVRNPIYGGHDVKVGLEIMGGKVVSLTRQGEAAASIALEVLSGTPASLIPINRERTHRLLFDHRYLKRFGVNQRSLPAEAEIIGRPANLIRDNAALFAGILITVLVLCFLILLLLHINRKLKLKEIVLVDLRKKADVANHAKSEFLSVVSHELKTPLNPILGMTHLLEHKLGPSADSEITGGLAVITRSAERLLSLVNDILDFNRFEGEKVQPALETFEFEVALEQTLKRYSVLAKDKGLDFKVTDLEKEKLFLKTDQNLFVQLLDNLLSNAVKFTREGSVELMIEKLETDSSFQFRFSVIDTGSGISPEEYEHAAAPFSQADSSTTRHQEGAGLGLSICQHINKILDAKMTLTRTDEGGSCLSISIPSAIGESE